MQNKEKLYNFLDQFKTKALDDSLPSGFLAPLYKENSERQYIASLVDKFKDSEHIYIIGIGGSNLATKALWHAFEISRSKEKLVTFVESLDNSELEHTKGISKNVEKLEDLCIIATSKSGSTTETIDSFKKVYNIFKERFGSEIDKRTIIISSKTGQLFNLSQELSGEEEIDFVEWQGDIGGRYSAFSVAHTLPLSILGFDTKKFLNGAKEAYENNSTDLAISIYEACNKGVDILDFFTFNSELEFLGKWFRQLVAESLGKQKSNGEIVNITPTVSVGPRDLHSMLQLYLSGVKNRYTIFLYSKKEGENTTEYIAYKNTVDTYKNQGLESTHVEIEEINEHEIGKIMCLFMLSVVYLGVLLGVDPFNQPAVEDYKKNFKN